MLLPGLVGGPDGLAIAFELRSSRRCKSLHRFMEGFQKAWKDSQKGRKRKRVEKEKEKGL